MRVVLVDDHVLVRAGLRLLLEGMPGFSVTEAGDGQEGLESVRREQPDIVLTDIAMKGMNGLELAAQIKREFPQIKVIILSMYANEEYVLQALRAGASGYLLKESAPTELEFALKAVQDGDTYLSPPVSRQVVESYMARTGGEKKADPLTPRQREILVMIGEGHSTKEIAHMLSLSVKTVETHRAQLMERLNIHDVPGLVRYAIRMGLVSVDK